MPITIIVGLLILVSILVSVPAFPATYEVTTTGDDANAGDAGGPWRTLQHAADQVSPGDEVVVHPGSYSESVALTRSGTADNPIAFRFDPGAVLVSPDPAASMEAFDVTPGTGYITLVGVEATGGFDETIFLRSGVHDVRIEGCNLHHNHAGIIMADAGSITVDHCSIHDNLNLGIRFAGSTHDVVVSDTESALNFTGVGCLSTGDGFAAEQGSSAITFRRVRAIANGGDGFDLQGDGMQLEDVESSGNGCTGIKLWQSATIRGCLSTGNARGLAVTTINGGSTVDIANCTVAANNGVGLDLNPGTTAGTQYTALVRNSIFSGAFKSIQYVSLATLSESHNIFFRPSPYDPVLAPVNLRGTNGHDVNLGRWARRSRQGSGTLAVDPLFVDPANGDFRVVPTSAAVGRGTDLGNTLASGPPPNIGAYAEPTQPTNHSPFADAGRNRTSRKNRRLLFNATGSIDADGDPLTYTWDFGDGSTPLGGLKARHAYTASGIYTVTLTVSDGTSTGSTTITVTVL